MQCERAQAAEFPGETQQQQQQQKRNRGSVWVSVVFWTCGRDNYRARDQTLLEHKQFFCCKQYYGTACMIVCNYNLCITYLHSGDFASAHDSRITATRHSLRK
ncbi:hypothetical protein G6F56_011060 [Rhizopus delemar]|nr:hypothetical protein G6F56_011060 [Rhizopus delemar]